MADIKFSDFQKEPFRLKDLVSRIKDYYQEEWRLFISLHKKNLKYVCLIFILSIVLSYLYFESRPDQVSKAFISLSKYYKKQAWLHDPPVVQCLAIFWNNSTAALTAYLGGLVPFLILPILRTAFTAGTFSLIAVMIRNRGEKVIPVFLALIAPHGVIEFPAMIYSFTLGLYLSQQMTIKILKRRKKPAENAPSELFGSFMDDSSVDTKDLLFQVGGTFAGVILPLLLLAAVIETFLTPVIGKAYLG